MDRIKGLLGVTHPADYQPPLALGGHAFCFTDDTRSTLRCQRCLAIKPAGADLADLAEWCWGTVPALPAA